MTHVTCRLTAKNRDRVRNPTLGNRVWATFFVVSYRNRSVVVRCGCVQDWFHRHKPSVAPHFRPYVPDALPSKWYRDFERAGTQDSMWEMWFIHYMHIEQVRERKLLGRIACIARSYSHPEAARAANT